MRRAGPIAVALLAALAGCKGTTPKPADGREPVGTPAGRTKGKNNAWLDDPSARLPGAGIPVPKGTRPGADPSDPRFDLAREKEGVVAGRVIGPDGRGARGVYVKIDPADPTPAERQAGDAGVLADDQGYFFTNVLTPGRVYTLSVKASAGGQTLYGAVQTRPPQPTLTIALRDDLPPPGRGDASDLPPPDNKGFTPPARPETGGFTPPARPDGSGGPTPPARQDRPPVAVPADGAFTPGVGSTSRPLPASIDTPPAPAPAAPPAAARPTPPDPQPVAPVPVRPENTATGPAPPFRPQPLSIPNPNGPPLPALPPPVTPPVPPAPAPEKKSQRAVKPGADFALVDAAGRPWELGRSRSGSVVLVEFLTTACGPCKAAVPGLVGLQGDYAAAGLEVVGVVCDEGPADRRRALAAKYQRDQQLNYALYTEPAAGAVRERRFGVESYPTAVLLGADGAELWRGNPLSGRAALEAAVRQAVGR